MEWMRPRALAAGSLLVIAAAVSASGQSFDCAQAATSQEKFICAHRGSEMPTGARTAG